MKTKKLIGDEIFLSRCVPLDMNDPYVFDKYKNKKTIRVSRLVKCPLMSVTIQEGEKQGQLYEYDDDSKENFIQGTREHFMEELLESGSKGIVQAEKQMFVYSPELDVVIEGRPDKIALDLKGMFINDTKTCKPGAFYFKLKNGGLAWNHNMQLSIYAYIFYTCTGVHLKEGTITFIDKTNSRRRLIESDHLFKLKVTENFIFSHPLMTGKLIEEKTKEYIENGMGFVCGLCEKGKTCKFHNKDVAKEEERESKNATEEEVSSLNEVLSESNVPKQKE